VFATAARTFFDRPAPAGYLENWAKWLATSAGRDARGGELDENQERVVSSDEGASVLIFRLGEEWLALRTEAVAQVTEPRPVHHVPGRSNDLLLGLVSLEGQAQLCVSLHSLLGITSTADAQRLIVLRDRGRAESWAFAADEVRGVHRVPRSLWRSPPTTLGNPAVGFTEAVLSWRDRSVGLLDEQRVLATLRSLGR
jgi:chemotaxis-related protein WspD